MTRTGDRADFPPRLGQSVDLTKPEELALPSGHSSQPLSARAPDSVQVQASFREKSNLQRRNEVTRRAAVTDSAGHVCNQASLAVIAYRMCAMS
jgi:hypothetical protein